MPGQCSSSSGTFVRCGDCVLAGRERAMLPTPSGSKPRQNQSR
ncbi:hypothetical protein EaACW_0977 [Erwinia amylovora ACW56400]|uniref:Uncharacterized protein n=1 Tax=Erwinia amylovora ATCC BAA-2158 TaxID=889211 RepID=E5B2W3_ERWAM|nr:hypothetical protein EaACW_0977 [Erwinia amylovora ACW56400]CBX79815.1 hypothetical protein predicted by Glimmer/Critica [Erwinia amylovora ATCC BAA-2158]CCO77820.1 hypothetical protein BN432_0998 [Erwinia amylovora Ea356]CCO81606.1 hypothetical protein BN433_1011 [Erwinia amylovora Ea266]CCO85408.1 hypothetical protein BN434_0996 [Erwinia amylovora CFBP 2585]CCO89194.1 hypothetical protein BN435_0998 [Erwinia amylovora 01SFR-BO]CCO98302.1 hypothetical protein BN438_0996 [Erwinia amylovora